jgi:predicted metal-binding membrane protein
MTGLPPAFGSGGGGAGWRARGGTLNEVCPAVDFVLDMSGGVAGVVEPECRSWSVADFEVTFAMWAVMMVGMMMPSVAPMVLLYAVVGRSAGAVSRPRRDRLVRGGLSFGLDRALSFAATWGQWTLTRLALLTPMMESASSAFGGSVLSAAGVYQWSSSQRDHPDVAAAAGRLALRLATSARHVRGEALRGLSQAARVGSRNVGV